MTQVRTRFAPSPTGSLHVGNARTAVLNWLIARHHGGAFILRIEDTDAGRNVAGAEARLMADLRWLGLEWDEGPEPDGDERGSRGPYRQSQRASVYARYAQRLLDAGAAYRCFCDPATLEAGRERAHAEGRPPGYPGTCRTLDPAAATERAAGGAEHVLRLATPESGDVVVDDLIRGKVSFDATTMGDFVLVRSDGGATYNFAVVVDDAEMAITHVIRGSGHLSNTPHQVLLYRALGLEPPAFAHTPTVLGADRSKLSKRSGARPLEALADEGLHPDAVINYLSLLGWSSPSGEEVLSRERLVDEVTLERMSASDVVFDPEKLSWLSAQHIAQMGEAELTEAVRPYVERSPHSELLDDRFATVLGAVRSHLSAFSEITDHLAPFVGPASEPRVTADAVPVLRAVCERLSALDEWSDAAATAALKEAGATVGVRGRELYVPVRQALTGAEHGPPLGTILAVQGRERALGHLDRALSAAADPV